MSRVAPTSGTKVLYFLLIIISGFLIYIDLKHKSFEGIKNFYQSFIISSSYIFKSATVEPIKLLYQISKDKNELINENKKLKLELDNSHILNFIISNDSKFFADDQSIQNFLNLNKITKTFHLAKIDYFDAEQFLCCSKHRFFIETYNPHDLDFLDSPVINKTGILGQIINTKSIYEVLLLTDTSHVMPIFSGNNFCNARGSGNPGLIKCTFNSLIWEGSVEIGQEFFSSGMGGVYPKGVLIGEVSDIREIEENIFEFDINLKANPLDSNVVGVIENL
ncbi:MAG: rod shape-determining protein MreC [Proteobacteria bacterium]|nr:rod shape-determining protein MreC [Pseudomonadota bacterium]